MKIGLCGSLRWLCALALIPTLMSAVAHGQTAPNSRPQPPATLGLEQGTMDLDTPDFTLKLVKSSQTVAALQPKGADGFDFTPADWLPKRASNGYYHLGDLTLRTRHGASGPWQEYSTATARQAVLPLPASGRTLAAADLTPTLPADCPLQITRAWMLEDGRLALRFTLKNIGTDPVQIGALGIPMVFNNILTDRTLEQAHATCSFSDPYIGQDAGYVQVTRLTGHGPALVVVPDGKRRSRATDRSASRCTPTRPSRACSPGMVAHPGLCRKRMEEHGRPGTHRRLRRWPPASPGPTASVSDGRPDP